MKRKSIITTLLLSCAFLFSAPDAQCGIPPWLKKILNKKTIQEAQKAAQEAAKKEIISAAPVVPVPSSAAKITSVGGTPMTVNEFLKHKGRFYTISSLPDNSPIKTIKIFSVTDLNNNGINILKESLEVRSGNVANPFTVVLSSTGLHPKTFGPKGKEFFITYAPAVVLEAEARFIQVFKELFPVVAAQNKIIFETPAIAIAADNLPVIMDWPPTVNDSNIYLIKEKPPGISFAEIARAYSAGTPYKTTDAAVRDLFETPLTEGQLLHIEEQLRALMSKLSEETRPILMNAEFMDNIKIYKGYGGVWHINMNKSLRHLKTAGYAADVTKDNEKRIKIFILKLQNVLSGKYTTN